MKWAQADKLLDHLLIFSFVTMDIALTKYYTNQISQTDTIEYIICYANETCS